jgi:branched-chain amino acid transport system permease protein
MESKIGRSPAAILRNLFSGTPLLAWLTGALVAVLCEKVFGLRVADALGLPRIPVLFGILFILKEPSLIPGALLYTSLTYIAPACITARITAPLANKAAALMLRASVGLSVLVHLALLYSALHFWTDVSDYRLITVKLTLIAIIVTLSLNVINGYMGEFSCSHPGFLALGAYTATVFNLVFFVNDRFFGPALAPPALGPIFFPVGLVLGGIVAAVGALMVAIPSFRTRGDYLAIISLAFMFIVKSFIENLEIVGGPRGLSRHPDYATLPVVFAWTSLCIWIINNFVRSTVGKALNAVRDDETAANSMTINTRQTKMTAFLFAAFWAGVAGGLFAHVIRYVNPGMFGIQNLAEVLAMVYFGGLNSVYGSILGAVGIQILSEVLRPLEIFKWIIIPLLLILVMIFRPTGLIAFREFVVEDLVKPKRKGV